MSTPESDVPLDPIVSSSSSNVAAADFVSSLEGWALIRKYIVCGRVVEVETMIVKKTRPLDTSGGWRVIHEGGDIVWIERMI